MSRKNQMRRVARRKHEKLGRQKEVLWRDRQEETGGMGRQEDQVRWTGRKYRRNEQIRRNGQAGRNR
jgi:hypothetical protein